ncbi:hypothetical protein MKZ38_006051 [Zalerion maritima]|uniref:Uncharacterized protein n=1 Tax=Zalerion maritima TaxID=339359 RepID=A0AAD5RJC0_9PEZI|nr:hypothetical protein MKZ38_006051 [Zalerion maritima]
MEGPEGLVHTAILDIVKALQDATRATPPSILQNKKLARLRRRRRKLIVMLMFSISGVAASCMPEFVRIGEAVEKDPWLSDSEYEDEDLEEEIDGLGPPAPMPFMSVHAAATVGTGTGHQAQENAGPGDGSNNNDNNAGQGGGNDHGNPIASLPPILSIPIANAAHPPLFPQIMTPADAGGPGYPTAMDEENDWINDALTGGTYISQALANAVLGGGSAAGPPSFSARDNSENGILSANGLEVRVGDNEVVKLKSHPREVRRLISVFDHAWRTVLEDLDIMRAYKFLLEREKAIMKAKDDLFYRKLSEELFTTHELGEEVVSDRGGEIAAMKREWEKNSNIKIEDLPLGIAADSPTLPHLDVEGSAGKYGDETYFDNFPQLSTRMPVFDPFRSNRPERTANEAVGKINKIGKRIMRRVVLDRRVLVARAKKKEQMKTGSAWRAMVP